MEEGEGKMIIGMKGETRDRVRDQRIERVEELVPPEALLGELPLGDEREERRGARARRSRQRARRRATTGCWSSSGPAACTTRRRRCDYAGRLAEQARELSGDLLIAMRVYFEKPRTTTGWKGLINDPHLDGSCDVNTGLRMARQLLLEVLDSACRSAASSSTRSRRSTSPTRSPGARSAPARPRARSTASSAPASRCRSASRTAPTATSRSRSTRFARPRRRTPSPASTTPAPPAILHTTGNPDGHVILRGGRGAPNYRADGVVGALELLARGRPGRAAGDRRLARQQRQGPRPAAARRRRDRRPGGRRQRGDRRRHARVVPGRGPPGPRRRATLTYGQSITDACIDWERNRLGARSQLASAARARRGG